MFKFNSKIEGNQFKWIWRCILYDWKTISKSSELSACSQVSAQGLKHSLEDSWKINSLKFRYIEKHCQHLKSDVQIQGRRTFYEQNK